MTPTPVSKGDPMSTFASPSSHLHTGFRNPSDRHTMVATITPPGGVSTTTRVPPGDVLIVGGGSINWELWQLRWELRWER